MIRAEKLVLQWHITDHCNCHCTHCYQEEKEKQSEPDKLSFLNTVAQFKELLAYLKVRGQITLTGGEPFLHNDFFVFLEVLAANQQFFDFAILTNGTMIDQDIAKRLKTLQPLFVQVSIEGTEVTHDKIRGTGNYKKTVEAMRYLVGAGVRTFISFTAHHDNFREFAYVADLGRKVKVDKVWSDRYIPIGQGTSLQALTKEETKEYFSIMEQAQKKTRWFSKTKIGLDRGLQFLLGGGYPYHCVAGDNLITLMPNGDIYPCRRMPILSGNISKADLKDIYCTSPIFLRLRNTAAGIGCNKCIYTASCRGGLRCLAYAVYGDFQKADPGCWYAEQE